MGQRAGGRASWIRIGLSRRRRRILGRNIVVSLTRKITLKLLLNVKQEKNEKTLQIIFG